MKAIKNLWLNNDRCIELMDNKIVQINTMIYESNLLILNLEDKIELEREINNLKLLINQWKKLDLLNKKRLCKIFLDQIEIDCNKFNKFVKSLE